MKLLLVMLFVGLVAVPARPGRAAGDRPGDVAANPATATRPDDDPEFPELTVDIVRRGSSSWTALRKAQAALPLNRLNARQRQRADRILRNRSMFRRLPTVSLEAEPDVYRWFTRNPEAAVSIWRVLQISQFELTPHGRDTWTGKANDGSNGTIEVLLRTPTEQLLLCEGEYKNPLLPKPIQARALMYLKTQSEKQRGGVSKITHDLDLFVSFPSQTVETVAKVISPVSNMIADRNFRELSLFVRFMTVAMQRQPGWVEQVSQRIDGVTNRQREELLKLSAGVFVANRLRNLQAQGIAPTSARQIVAPFGSPVSSGREQR